MSLVGLLVYGDKPHFMWGSRARAPSRYSPTKSSVPPLGCELRSVSQLTRVNYTGQDDSIHVLSPSLDPTEDKRKVVEKRRWVPPISRPAACLRVRYIMGIRDRGLDPVGFSSRFDPHSCPHEKIRLSSKFQISDRLTSRGSYTRVLLEREWQSP